MSQMLVDLKGFLRHLRKNPTFTIVVLLMLTVGAGADALMFSVAYSVLLRPLPYPQGERLVQLNSVTPQGEISSTSWLNFQDWQSQAQSFSSSSAYTVQNSSLQFPNGDSGRLITASTSANLLKTLQVDPVLGRSFLPDEDQAQKPCVALLSNKLWKSRFGGSQAVLGTSVRLDNQPCTVIGVMGEGFAFPDGNDNGLWTPLHPAITSRGTGYLSIISRLKDGVTPASAQSELNIMAQRLGTTYPEEDQGLGIKAISYHDVVTGDVSTALWALIGAVVLVQLIICANVGNMQLARALGRKKEIAIRLALGAGRWRVAKQMLMESFLLALIGSVVGVVIAYGCLSVLRNMATNVLPRANEIQLYPQVCLALLATAALTAILFSLVPVFQTNENDLEATLRESGRGINGGGKARSLAREAMIVGQLALAVMLLFGSVVLLHSMYKLLQQDTGFSSQSVLTLRTSITDKEYESRNIASSLYLPQVERIQHLPGVQAAGLVTYLPLSLGHTSARFIIVNRPNIDPQHPPKAALNAASEDYFKALRVPLIKGRFFTADDGLTAPRVTIINDALAQRYFPNEDPIGQKIAFGDPDYLANPMTVVGVVHGSRQQTLAEPPEPEIYFCLRQIPPQSLWSQILLSNVMTYVVRSSGSPEALTTSVSGAIHSVDSGLTLFDVQTMDDVVARFVQNRRLALVLLGLFAALALLVASAGLYAMLSYSVQQRKPEIAVRMALGAKKVDVLQLIAGRAFMLNMIGLGIGIAGAISGSHLIANLLYGVQKWDPLTLVSTCVVLLVITFPAALIPAYRAASVNVLNALRTD